MRSIIISANSRLSYMQNEKVLRILDHDDINIPWLGEGALENPEKKTALFAVIPDNDKPYNFIVGLLYTQVFQELYLVRPAFSILSIQPGQRYPCSCQGGK